MGSPFLWRQSMKIRKLCSNILICHVICHVKLHVILNNPGFCQGLEIVGRILSSLPESRRDLNKNREIITAFINPLEIWWENYPLSAIFKGRISIFMGEYPQISSSAEPCSLEDIADTLEEYVSKLKAWKEGMEKKGL